MIDAPVPLSFFLFVFALLLSVLRLAVRFLLLQPLRPHLLPLPLPPPLPLPVVSSTMMAVVTMT